MCDDMSISINNLDSLTSLLGKFHCLKYFAP